MGIINTSANPHKDMQLELIRLFADMGLTGPQIRKHIEWAIGAPKNLTELTKEEALTVFEAISRE